MFETIVHTAGSSEYIIGERVYIAIYCTVSQRGKPSYYVAASCDARAKYFERPLEVAAGIAEDVKLTLLCPSTVLQLIAHNKDAPDYADSI